MSVTVNRGMMLWIESFEDDRYELLLSAPNEDNGTVRLLTGDSLAEVSMLAQGFRVILGNPDVNVTSALPLTVLGEDV